MQKRDVDRRQVRASGIRLRRLPEEHLRQEPRQTDRHQVDHDARHDVVHLERDRGDRVDAGEQETTDRSHQESEDGSPREPEADGVREVAGPPRAGDGPDDHQAFQADVHDARSLAEQTAESGQVEDREVRERDLQRDADVGERHVSDPPGPCPRCLRLRRNPRALRRPPPAGADGRPTGAWRSGR